MNEYLRNEAVEKNYLTVTKEMNFANEVNIAVDRILMRDRLADA
jgi:hypothetical protein